MSDQEHETLMPSALAKATAGDRTSENASAAVGCVIALGLLALGGWGVVSCTSAAGRAIQEGADKARAEKTTNQAPEPPKADEGYSDTAAKAAAIQAVKRRLLDDRSARFRNVVVVPSEVGTKAVCGEVNSKNRAGGYAGYQRFISAGVDKYTWLQEDMPDFASAWDEVCVR